MKRFHALEWEDLSWFPTSWRDYSTDYLRFIAVKFDIYKPTVPIIIKGLEKSEKKIWVDLASGGGGGLLKLASTIKATNPELKILLTDFFPNEKAFLRMKQEMPDTFDYEKSPVNALSPPTHLGGTFKTLFAAFHHFKPHDARSILQNAVDSNSNIAIFEPVGRNVGSWLSMLFVPLNVLIFTLFIRPVRWKVLPFIYLIPLIPIYILWDGIASILRTYSEKELWGLVHTVKKSESFTWEIGKTPGKMPISYLLGYKNTEI